MTLELPKRLTRTLAVVLWLIVSCATIGYANSPRDTNGRPVLLLPDVRAAEAYRRSVAGWTREWRGLVVALYSILADDGELFATNQKTQQAFTRSMELAAEVDAGEAPASMIGLRAQAAAASEACVTASLAVARWVSGPSADNKTAAHIALTAADQRIATLDGNAWLSHSR